MPAHVRHARKLAEEAELSNIRFVEADFMQLAQSPVSLLDGAGSELDGQVDYAVAHGLPRGFRRRCAPACGPWRVACCAPVGCITRATTPCPDGCRRSPSSTWSGSMPARRLTAPWRSARHSRLSPGWKRSRPPFSPRNPG
ncbi:MAG: hypothetical protein IPK05_18170 [Comamonadaceae bacterium]|nr:hypothetical protein [Comamonadaceae bacterium]